MTFKNTAYKVSDEDLLHWVRERAAGKHPREIAPDRYDTCAQETTRVLNHDLKHSGEPEGHVRSQYWAPMRRGRKFA